MSTFFASFFEEKLKIIKLHVIVCSEVISLTVGERIAARRKELNMTQEELAHKMGYKSKSSINKIELKWANVPLSKLERVAAALDCEPAYLMGWEEEDPDGKIRALAEQTVEEQRLLQLWRKADGIDKQTIWNILSRYEEDGAIANTSTG